MRVPTSPLRRARWAVPVALLLTAGAAPAVAADGLARAAAPASATTSAAPAGEAPAGGCADDGGVSVVVDFTDLGGEVVAGCAEGDPGTGRDALLEAGFSATDDAAGMICAIDASPDPCPAEFTGSFWSYWTATPDGEWAMHMEGADTIDPAPGTLEGWRYSDGSAGPGVRPADVVAAAAEGSTPASAGTTATAEPDAEDTSAEDEAQGQAGVMTAVGVAVLALLAAGAVVVARRRRA